MSLADPVMLAKIDRLFSCNVGSYIDLPQIVVVGDQSSGKSSVLVGLTGLPFPRDSELCTRYATQIIFRRSKVQRVNVSIIPSKHADAVHCEQVRAWTKDVQNLDEASFKSIVSEVQVVMGISFGKSSLKTFSNDVLRIEVNGPTQEHLSVIDIPGIFKRTTSGVTSKADMALVQAMVQDYMKNSRSVILAVVPANVDVATQEILEMAEEVDPDGLRTLGVLTKPDIVDRGAEVGPISLIEGRKHQLKLGWHMIRNPGQQESADPKMNRDELETTFFACEAPWNQLPKENVGISALKVRLREIISSHTRREFPKVKSELNKRLSKSRAQLLSLGQRRDNQADQSSYLIDIATRFQEIATSALEARYGRNPIFNDDPTLRLATQIVSMTELFSNRFEEFGHTYEFTDEAKPPEDGTAKSKKDKVKTKTSNTRFVENHIDISDLLADNCEMTAPKRSGIINWLTDVYNKSRGFELASFDPDLLAVAVREQSGRWISLALGYVSDVATIVHGFIVNLIHLVCADEGVSLAMISLMMDGLTEKYKRAITQVEYIMQIELSGRPVTQNKAFNQLLSDLREERTQEGTGLMPSDDFSYNKDGYGEDDESRNSKVKLTQITQDLHDILKAYYEVARARIVDIIYMQAAIHHLVSGPDSPIKLFSPAFVAKMTEEQLEAVAGEDPMQVYKRRQLQKEIDELERGRKILS